VFERFLERVAEMSVRYYKDSDYCTYYVKLLSYLTEVPTMTMEYYTNFLKQDNEMLLIFYGIPHVHFKGTLDFESLQIIIT